MWISCAVSSCPGMLAQQAIDGSIVCGWLMTVRWHLQLQELFLVMALSLGFIGFVFGFLPRLLIISDLAYPVSGRVMRLTDWNVPQNLVSLYWYLHVSCKRHTPQYRAATPAAPPRYTDPMNLGTDW